jgi:hypothetical protein
MINMDNGLKPRPKGRPRKIYSQEKDEESDNSSVKTVKSTSNNKVELTEQNHKEELKIAKLKYKHDNIDKVRQQQNERYNKIKGELTVKRLLRTIMSEKYSNDQRKQVLYTLENNLKEKTNTD